ncbi:MAG: hypothetical protein ABIO02_03915, partial [Patescibacteria group bacterium]
MKQFFVLFIVIGSYLVLTSQNALGAGYCTGADPVQYRYTEMICGPTGCEQGVNCSCNPVCR